MRLRPLPQLLLGNLLQGHVDVSSLGVPKDHPVVLGRPSGDVVERLLPERQHLLEVAAIDDYGADFHHRLFYSRRLKIIHEAMVFGSHF